jgi:hypothetical protein
VRRSGGEVLAVRDGEGKKKTRRNRSQEESTEKRLAARETTDGEFRVRASIDQIVCLLGERGIFGLPLLKDGDIGIGVLPGC